MPTRMPLIDSRMTTKQADFFPQTCTIQTFNETQSSSGMPINTPADFLTDIACRIAPTVGKEIKKPDGTYTVGSHVILLAGHYATITTKMVAVIDSITYDILAVEFDAEHETTRLPVQVVT